MTMGQSETWDSAAERLVWSIRDTIVALEHMPTLTPPQARLLANLRAMLAEWEAG